MLNYPVGNFTLNRYSQQARGLVFWLPLVDLLLTDRVRAVSLSTTGSPFIVRDVPRSAYQFNGTTEYLSVTTAPVTAPPFTIACWCYQRSAATRVAVSLNNSADTTNFHNLEITSASVYRCRSQDATTVSSAQAAVTAPAVTWHHLVGVFAATNDRRAFLNGGNKGTSASSRTPSGINQLTIGALGGSTKSEFINGNLADIRIYNRALSDEEVTDLYNPDTRWQLYEPVKPLWAIGFTAAAPAVTEISRPNVKPVASKTLALPYLRI